jgi:SAM-dependent methyltransferase
MRQMRAGIDESEIRRLAEPFTPRYQVHEEDLLFDFILGQFGQDAGIQGYFEGGRNDAARAMASLQKVHTTDSPLRVLEFASGYGRITRHSGTVFAGHSYTASDIHPQACEFIKTYLGVRSLESTTDPDSLPFDEKWDFIFVFSLFSHLPDKSFGRWLQALYDRLDVGGSLLFTTHGEFALRKIPEAFVPLLDCEKGWGYRGDSDQPDLDASEYGTMIVTPRYVVDMIERHCPGGDLRRFEYGVWFGLQDEWIITKSV